MSIKDRISSLFVKKEAKQTKAKTERRRIGDIGEDAACEYLISKGYSIIDRNVRVSHKELDIVAEDELTTVIVEVKTLSLTKEEAEQNAHRASEQIDRKKAENILFAAKHYLSSHYNGKQPRIDVIEVYLGGPSPEIVHMKNAINKLMLTRRRR